MYMQCIQRKVRSQLVHQRIGDGHHRSHDATDHLSVVLQCDGCVYFVPAHCEVYLHF